MTEESGFLSGAWRFVRSAGTGFRDAAFSTANDVAQFAKGAAEAGYRLATDDQFREQVWNSAKETTQTAKESVSSAAEYYRNFDSDGFTKDLESINESARQIGLVRDLQDSVDYSIDYYRNFDPDRFRNDLKQIDTSVRDFAIESARKTRENPESAGRFLGMAGFEAASNANPAGWGAKAAKLARLAKMADHTSDLMRVTSKAHEVSYVRKVSTRAENTAERASKALHQPPRARMNCPAEKRIDHSKSHEHEFDGKHAATGPLSLRKRLPESRLPCFNPYDNPGFAKLNPAQRREYLREYARQLGRQQDAINKMKIEDFRRARVLFRKFGRHPLSSERQAQARKEFQVQLIQNITESLALTLGPREAERLARLRAETVMEQLAALHEPDMIAGGFSKPEPVRMGGVGVNSSIGASWSSRLDDLDKSVRRAAKFGQASLLMNVKLEVCRGRGLR